MAHPRRNVGVALFTLGFVLFTVMTVIAYVEDARDPRVRAQLERQAAEEAAFRAAPFAPLRSPAGESNLGEARTGGNTDESGGGASTGSTGAPPPLAASSSAHPAPVSATTPPASYTKHCSGCHGTRGQGVAIFPKLIGVSAKPRRTVEDIIAILNDPASYGLQPAMPSFAAKLSDDEKREIAAWVAALKKG